MTTQNAREKEQGMSEGYYVAEHTHPDYPWIIEIKDGDGVQHMGMFTNQRDASVACGALNRLAVKLEAKEEDLRWLTENWQRHRKALNAIAWGQYDNEAFPRRLAQDELAIGTKAALERAARDAHAALNGGTNG